MSPKPRPSITSLFLALLCVLYGHVSAAPRYNVLLIMADDLRPAMGCCGDA